MSALEEKMNSEKKWLGETLLVAVTPLIAYFFSYRHEAAYAKVFGLPLKLIEIDLTTVLTVVGLLLSIYIFIFMISYLVFTPLLYARGPLPTSLFGAFGIALIVLVHVFVYGSLWREWIVFAAIAAIVLIFYFVYPLISQRGKGSYTEKLQAQEAVETTHPDLIDRLLRSSTKSGLFIFLLLLFGYFASDSAGRAKALKQQEFFILKTHPQLVVLAFYGDKIICAPFDEKTKRVRRELEIFDVTDSDVGRLYQKRIGPLTLDTVMWRYEFLDTSSSVIESKE